MSNIRPYSISPDDIVTYSLRRSDAGSNDFYRTIQIFSDEVLNKGREFVNLWIEDLLVRTSNTLGPDSRTIEEIILDLLTLGVLWREYSVSSLNEHWLHPHLPGHPLESRLPVQSREVASEHLTASSSLKPLYDKSVTRELLHPLTIAFNALLDWLEHSGEFEQEVKRLKYWYDRWILISPRRRAEALGLIARYTRWFEARSHEILGDFTPNVDKFVSQIQGNTISRENAIFIGRRRLEYHLNMVGTELLNRAYRQDFSKTSKKVIVLPPCMRLQPTITCKAKRNGTISRCTGCTPGCRIHHVTCLGKKMGIDVQILEGDLTTFTGKTLQDIPKKELGIIGVSCVLTNTPGGFAAWEAGIPAQGLLLDYCGCWWHWHKSGIPTDINLKQLIQILRC